MNWCSLKEMMMSLLVCDLETDACSNGHQISLLSFLILPPSYGACSYSFMHRLFLNKLKRKIRE